MATTSKAKASSLCSEHFPAGWEGLGDDVTAVGCEHGSWTKAKARVTTKEAKVDG